MPEGRQRESKEIRYCVLIIVIGAGIFIVGTTLNQDVHIVTALSILGAVIFLSGTFTLLLVLIGFSQPVRSKPTEDSDNNDPNTFHVSNLYRNNLTHLGNTTSPVDGSSHGVSISLPECPKFFTTIKVQPPPSYEEAIAMSDRKLRKFKKENEEDACKHMPSTSSQLHLP